MSFMYERPTYFSSPHMGIHLSLSRSARDCWNAKLAKHMNEDNNNPPFQKPAFIIALLYIRQQAGMLPCSARPGVVVMTCEVVAI